MTIDEEIEMLKNRLAELQKEKDKAIDEGDLVEKKLKDTKIKVFGDDPNNWNEVIKTFDCFKDLYDFWKSKMNKTDYIYLEYYSKPDSKYIEHECYSYDDFIKIVNIKKYFLLFFCARKSISFPALFFLLVFCRACL